LVHKRRKIGSKLVPALSILLHSQPSHTVQAALRWRRTANINEIVFGFFAAQVSLVVVKGIWPVPSLVLRGFKKILSWQSWHRVGRL